MKIFLGADHRGFVLKEALSAWLHGKDHEVIDVGAKILEEDDDYPDYGVQVAQHVMAESGSLGIVICGSGAGMAVVADKVKGVRAALIHDSSVAKAARADDDINVLALGADFITEDEAKQIVEAFITTPFSGQDRHRRRINKIAHYEHDHSCPCAIAPPTP